MHLTIKENFAFERILKSSQQWPLQRKQTYAVVVLICGGINGGY